MGVGLKNSFLTGPPEGWTGFPKKKSVQGFARYPLPDCAKYPEYYLTPPWPPHSLHQSSAVQSGAVHCSTVLAKCNAVCIVRCNAM